MQMARIAVGLVMMAGVSACGSVGKAPFEPLPDVAEMHRAAMSPVEMNDTVHAAPDTTLPAFEPMRLVSYTVSIPEELRVSEANLYYPMADIVWRGDPKGNRKQQVGTIFAESLNRAERQQQEGRAVMAEIEVQKFHSLTEKTRFTVGGMHSINFALTLKDVQTGETLVAKEKVKANLKAFGGRRAMEAEAQGLGMKERIQQHLARVIAAELTLPGGWTGQDTQLARAIDQI